jgi:hypothetical protein
MEVRTVEHVKIQTLKNVHHALKDFTFHQQEHVYHALPKDVQIAEMNSIVCNANVGSHCQDQVRHLSA